MALAEIILIAMGLLTLSMLAAGLFRQLAIPYSVVLVLIGLLLSELGQYFQPFHILEAFRLTPDLVFFVLLPALIFESGLGLNARQLLKDIAPVLSMAVPALLISTFLVGLGLWLAGLEFALALLFGALISATDPVAVIALFKELGAPLRLNVLIEGESLLNDATAIVLFGIILAMLISGESITPGTALLAVAEFFRVFIGGVIVGVLLGLLVSEMLQRLHSTVSEVLSMSIVLAYASFISAEHLLHVSGVMATLSAAITLNVYGLTRIEQRVKPALQESWELLALIANSLLFLLVGLFINIKQLIEHSDKILVAIVVVMLARGVAVYSMVPLNNRLFNLPLISLAERHIMWWGGLKGGLAIAIVLSIPESMAGRDLLINLTLGVVLFTLLVNATSIRPLMHWLKMDLLEDDEKMELQRGLLHAHEAATAQLERYQKMGIIREPLRRGISSRVDVVLAQVMPHTPIRQSWREVYLSALRTESFILEQLFETSLISQYTLLDLRNSLSRDRDGLSRNNLWDDLPQENPGKSIFQRVEMWVLKSLREKNWAASLLSSFQSHRLQQRLERDIAAMVMTQAVIDMLEHRKDFDDASRKRVIQLYQQRFERWSQRLQNLRMEFGETFEKLELHLFTRSSLKSAELNATAEFRHGEIGVKAFNLIQALIDQVLALLKHSNLNIDAFSHHSLAAIPLFDGLSDRALKVLAAHALPVSFMKGDIVIGEGEIGDALYIIRHGVAEVSRQGQLLAEIRQGEFFGEKALLGNHKRSATVTAKSMLSLLRLSRKDVMSIAAGHEEIRSRLQQVRDERLHNGDT